jgi:hypothetical protein
MNQKILAVLPALKNSQTYRATGLWLGEGAINGVVDDANKGA